MILFIFMPKYIKITLKYDKIKFHWENFSLYWIPGKNRNINVRTTSKLLFLMNLQIGFDFVLCQNGINQILKQL